MSTTRYHLSNEWDRARERLDLLQRVYDPPTVALLELAGIAEGSRVLEVGPGGGSITRWLCDRVGEAGYVRAVDLDARFVRELDFPQLDVCEADVQDEDLGHAEYDLVYARHLLVHVAAREELLTRLARAVKPGGGLALIEPDWVTWMLDPDAPHPIAEWYERWTASRLELHFAEDFARRVPRLMLDAGFELVEAHGRAEVMLPGADVLRMHELTRGQVLLSRVERGEWTKQEMDEALAPFDDPAFLSWNVMTVYALGRKPT